jgi:hypothetical protein
VATNRVEEIYEEYIDALSTIDRLCLVEITVHGLAATVHAVLQSRSLLDLE